MILSEKQLRRVIREELEKFMEAPQQAPNVLSIKNPGGGEIIMPNYTRERFDAGEIKSIGDII